MRRASGDIPTHLIHRCNWGLQHAALHPGPSVCVSNLSLEIIPVVLGCAARGVALSLSILRFRSFVSQPFFFDQKKHTPHPCGGGASRQRGLLVRMARLSRPLEQRPACVCVWALWATCSAVLFERLATPQLRSQRARCHHRSLSLRVFVMDRPSCAWWVRLHRLVTASKSNPANGVNEFREWHHTCTKKHFKKSISVTRHEFGPFLD